MLRTDDVTLPARPVYCRKTKYQGHRWHLGLGQPRRQDLSFSLPDGNQKSSRAKAFGF